MSDLKPGMRCRVTKPQDIREGPCWLDRMTEIGLDGAVVTLDKVDSRYPDRWVCHGEHPDTPWYTFDQRWLTPVEESGEEVTPKPSITTLPPEPLLLLVEQFTYGATKEDPTSGKTYGQHGWRNTEDARRKYLDAAYRHLQALLEGELHDADGRRHDIALAANALILADLADRDREEAPF